MRINKYLASCGVCSRRASEPLITEGRVKVNGKVVRDLTTQIFEDDKVELDGKILTYASEYVYIMMNKPRKVVTTCADTAGRKTVLDLLASSPKPLPRVFPVGRLDYETEGLLLLTNDGDFARRLTHPSSNINKTYIATLDRCLDGNALMQLKNGVVIDGTKTSPAKIERLDGTKISITIHEGRNRQVRKMCEAVGARVASLTRTAIGSLTLGDLKPGKFKLIKKPML